MTISKCFPRISSAAFAVAALVFSPLLRERAHAFGGLSSSEANAVQPTAAEILFVDNPDSSLTAIVQLSYAGPAQRFAWLIPLPGTPTVGVSSNAVFARLEAATTPQYWLELSVAGICAASDAPDASLDTSGTSGTTGAYSSAAIEVVEQGAIDAYEYSTIAVDPSLDDRAQAASDWLTANGYALAGVDLAVLDSYLKQGMSLLAVKLASDADAGAIRPLTFTYASERPRIPLRATAASARDDIGVLVWVVGPSQAVPANFTSLVLDDALIDWRTGRSYPAGTLPLGGAGPVAPNVEEPSNYDALVSAAVAEAGGRGFVTELGAPASPFRDKIWSTMDDAEWSMLSSASYADGIDAILAASQHYAGFSGWKQALAGATKLPANVSIDELDQHPEQYRGVVTVDTAKFFQLLEAQVIKPIVDTAALLYNAPYLTRLYTRMSPRAMSVDPEFAWNPNLAQVSSVSIAKQRIECQPALERADAPWRIDLPQGGIVVGKGSSDWPVAMGSLPANLKVVQLSTHGSGRVLVDNSAEIGMKLAKKAGTTGSGAALPRAPKDGVTIGGTQTVTMNSQASATAIGVKLSGGNACGISQIGTKKELARAPWIVLASAFALWIVRRSRRTAT